MELKKKSHRKNLFLWLRRNFLTGVAVAVPITVTAWLVISLISFVDERVKPLIPKQYNPETYLPFAIPGLGVIISVLALIFLGALAANFFGRAILNLGERIVDRLPLIRTVYRTVKQIVETIASQQEKSFSEVCLLEYPRKGLFVVAFITAEVKGELKKHIGEGYVGVFIPTTPNPTSGFLLYEKRENLKILDISVEAGAKLIISAGLISPEEAQAQIEKEKKISKTLHK